MTCPVIECLEKVFVLHVVIYQVTAKITLKQVQIWAVQNEAKQPESLHRNICGFEPVFSGAFIKVINKKTMEEGSQNSQRLSHQTGPEESFCFGIGHC